MSKRQSVVRVVLPDGINEISSDVRRLLEQFRYAGLITVHRDNDEGICFDLHCPHGLVSENWAKQNAERMRSFQYNAVSAPSTSQPEQSSLRPATLPAAAFNVHVRPEIDFLENQTEPAWCATAHKHKQEAEAQGLRWSPMLEGCACDACSTARKTRVYIAMSAYYWGRAFTIAEAMRQLKQAGGSTAKKKMTLHSVPFASYVDGGGSICYHLYFPETERPYNVDRTGARLPADAKSTLV